MTGRQLINSALRVVNAIGQSETPEHGMFENTRETLNMLLGSWSAEELMPHHYESYKMPLFAATPNYTIDPGDDFDSDSICMVQSPGGAGALTLNGTYVTSGVATADVPRHILIASTADDSARTFAIVGTSEYGDALTEDITGPNTTTVRGYKRFKTVTSVTIDGASAGVISVGTDYVINIRRPVKIPYAYLRDSTGLDTPLKVIDKNRYDEIEDKDEAGAPTKLYYDRSNPAGEVYVHPVPATGVALALNTGIECITNGAFASGSNWTIPGGSYWAISGGKAAKTAPAAEMLNNTSFDTTGAWVGTSDPNPDWTVAGDGLAVHSQTGTAQQGLRQSKVNMVSPLLANTQYTLTIKISAGAVFSTIGLYVTLGVSGGGYTSQGASSPITAPGTYTEIITTPSSSAAEGVEIRMEFTGGGIVGSHCDVEEISIIPVLAADAISQLAADLATPLVTGTDYTVTFDTSDVTAGSVSPAVGDTSGPSVSGSGSYSFVIPCGAGEDVDFDATGAFVGKIDNVSVADLPYSILTPVDYELIMDLWLPFVEITATNLDAEINLPGEYLLALRWNLAAEIAPEYGSDVSPYVVIRAEQTKDTVKRINGIIPKQQNPKTPVSSAGKQPATTQV